MNILITGGSGFIGGALVRHLKGQGEDVFAPSHSELDITNSIYEYVEKNKIQCIIHAAVDIRNSEEAYENNMLMFSSIMNCAEIVERIFIFDSAIAHSCNKAYLDESFNQYAVYAGSKKAMRIHVSASGYKNIKFITLAGVYGIGEDETRFTSYVIREALLGRDITLYAARIFSYASINTVCAFVKEALYMDLHNYCSNVYHETFYLLEVAYLIKRLCKSRSRIIMNQESMHASYTWSGGWAPGALEFKNEILLLIEDIKRRLHG